MSYISPNTTVILLKDVPLDPSYKNTLYFSGDGYQYTYFINKAHKMYSNNTYQRINRGVIRVEECADNIYGDNYMMFQNSNYGSKWFYAFVTSIDYVNDVTSEIHYVIDVMQTWFFETELKPCFVEREHTDDDTIGNNIAPEGLECGEYIGNGYTGMSAELDEGTYALSDLSVIVAICDTDNVADDSEDSASYEVEMHTYDGILSGSVYWAFQKSDVAGVESIVSTYIEAGKVDAIVDMYMVPTLALGFVPDIGGTKLDYYATNCMSYVWTLDDISSGATLDGYTPKNNKMYTYPYNFIGVDNGSGESMTLRYEFFNDTPRVTIHITLGYPVTATCRPTSYMNSETVVNNTRSISLTQYPQCSWNADYYSAWVAQNSVPTAINSGKSIVSTLSSGLGNLSNNILKTLNDTSNAPYQNLASAASMTGSYALSGIKNAANQIGQGGVTSIISSVVNGAAYIASTLANAYSSSIHSDISDGSYNIGNINCACNRQNFFASRYSVSHQYAEQIDNYFSRYGYAVRKIKVPNRNVREQWTYTKTIDCTVTGNVPAEDKVTIQNIYDNGVTFWRNPENVGDFTLDNNIG